MDVYLVGVEVREDLGLGIQSGRGPGLADSGGSICLLGGWVGGWVIGRERRTRRFERDAGVYGLGGWIEEEKAGLNEVL